MEAKKEIIALKAKVMIKKINKLHDLYKMISKKECDEESKNLEIIKKQYLQMYNELIEKEAYEKYKIIEDVIIYNIAKIEIKLDEYIYNTIQNYQEIIRDRIQKIKISSNYQECKNMDKSLNDVKILGELLKLYSPYIDKNEEKKIQYEISQLKFDVLYRNQIEDLIYQNKNTTNYLKQYNNEIEKEIFKKLLKEKFASIKFETDIFYGNSIEQILSDSRLLEKLIIIDIKSNPYDYINLLKAKIFNPHLCNIGNNPFEIEEYMTGKQLEEIGYGYMFSRQDSLKTNKVNYSLLVAILRNIITDENVSLIECEKLYKKFGFECNPIVINESQIYIKMIFDEVKGSTEFEKLLQEHQEDRKKDKKSQEGKYCKIDFAGLVYKFDRQKNREEDLLKQILDKKETESMTPIARNSKKEKQLQKIKEKGIITTDIDIIILLTKNIIDEYNKKIQELKQTSTNREFSSWYYGLNTETYEMEIKEAENNLKWLKELSNKREHLELEEIKSLLFFINDIYEKLGIDYNPREVLPLENTGMENSGQVRFAPIPEKSGIYTATLGHSFSDGFIHEKRVYYRTDLRPLWKKYKKEFTELHIDVKKYSKYYESEPCFEICVNLGDISDLPIDYKKVKQVTKEEMEEIIEREEGEVR